MIKHQRTRLLVHENETRYFVAKVDGNLYRRNGTVMLSSVFLEQTDEEVATHVWLHGDAAQALAGRGGWVRFRATVRRYEKVDGTVSAGLTRIKDVAPVKRK